MALSVSDPYAKRLKLLLEVVARVCKVLGRAVAPTMAADKAAIAVMILDIVGMDKERGNGMFGPPSVYVLPSKLLG